MKEVGMRIVSSRRTLVVLVAAALSLGVAAEGFAARNVIVMIPDGCSQSVQTLARWYTGEPLALDSMAAGLVSTYMADSVITDSAAAATAFACGVKTSDGFVGLGPRPEGVLSTLEPPTAEMQYRPVASVLEAARLMGKGTGLIATSRVSHATPAGYAAHVEDRDWDNEIVEHMVYQGVDVVFGGGSRHLRPTQLGGRRTDNEDLLQQLVAHLGYRWVDDRAGLLALDSGPVWGLFASSHMEAELDRLEFAPDQPSLAEMTAKAIEILDAEHPDGFFLMVEGSQVDWAGHAMDPIYMVTDFLAFDDAVRVAKDFAAADGDTLLIVFPDHNTGGLSIGNRTTDSTYTAVSVEQVVAPLESMRLTAYGLARKIGSDLSPANLDAKILEWWGIDPTDEEVNDILALRGAGATLDYAISEVLSASRTVLGWTTHGHTGEDVPLWTYGPNRPTGHFDNTELAWMVTDAFGFDLGVFDQLLFNNVADEFVYEVDTTDPANPVLRVGTCELPISKNRLTYTPRNMTFELDGLVVQVEATGRVYVPYLAAALLRALNGPGVAAMSQAQVKALADKEIATSRTLVAERATLGAAR
jgi:alkaline phosphatase